jgi:hypothetical protein
LIKRYSLDLDLDPNFLHSTTNYLGVQVYKHPSPNLKTAASSSSIFPSQLRTSLEANAQKPLLSPPSPSQPQSALSQLQLRLKIQHSLALAASLAYPVIYVASSWESGIDIDVTAAVEMQTVSDSEAEEEVAIVTLKDLLSADQRAVMMDWSLEEREAVNEVVLGLAGCIVGSERRDGTWDECEGDEEWVRKWGGNRDEEL